MISFITVPKPFTGKIAILQENAIRSWQKVTIGCEIILFGNEEGIKKTAEKLGVKQIPTINKNEFGTPLLDDVFKIAREKAKFNTICYINTDIIISHSFLEIFRTIQKLHNTKNYLFIGQRIDLDFDKKINFDNPNWEKSLIKKSLTRGVLHAVTGIDYFVFNKNLYKKTPPFAIGRTIWDEWLVYYAKKIGALVVDATPTVRIIHQNHNYNHHKNGVDGVWYGEEAKSNSILANNSKEIAFIDDTFIQLDRGKIRYNLFRAFQKTLKSLKNRFIVYLLNIINKSN